MTRRRVEEAVCSAVPSAVFAAVTSWSGLPYGVLAGCAAALGLTVAAALRGLSVVRAASGLVGVAVACSIAWLTGSAAGIFLPDIWWSLLACLILLGSVAVGFPLAGVVWSLARREPMVWRGDGPSRRALAVATLACAAVFGARFAVQRRLYATDEIGWLAAAKIAMGLPLTLLAIGVLAWAIRTAERRRSVPPSYRGPVRERPVVPRHRQDPSRGDDLSRRDLRGVSENPPSGRRWEEPPCPSTS